MNNVEQRLQRAAAETRQLAHDRWPRELDEKARRDRAASGWIVFAGAFTLVAMTFGLIPWLVGGTDAQPQMGDTPPLSAPADTGAPATTAPADPSTAAVSTCSADGVTLPPGPSGLPDAVAATGAAIVEAATSCDLAAIEALAGEGFTTSFGGGGVENFARWENEGEGKLGILVQILGMSHATVQTEGGEIYVWPAAFGYDRWDDIPDDLIDELRQIYTDEELDQISGLGSYGGWRTGIDQDGDWMFFVAGD
jgi:hypothetical protein